jgi:hypothetical protein
LKATAFFVIEQYFIGRIEAEIARSNPEME